MRLVAGLTLSTTKTIVVNFSSESNSTVKRIVSGAVGLGGAIAASVGACLGITSGPEASEHIWASPVDNFRSRAVSGFLSDRVRAYSAHALSALCFRAQLSAPDRCVVAAEQAAVASIFAAPMAAFTPDRGRSASGAWGRG